MIVSSTSGLFSVPTPESEVPYYAQNYVPSIHGESRIGDRIKVNSGKLKGRSGVIDYFTKKMHAVKFLGIPVPKYLFLHQMDNPAAECRKAQKVD